MRFSFFLKEYLSNILRGYKNSYFCKEYSNQFQNNLNNIITNMGLIMEFFILFKNKKTKEQIDEVILALPFEDVNYKPLTYSKELSNEYGVDIYSSSYYFNKSNDDTIIGFDVLFRDLEQGCLWLYTITRTYSYRLDFNYLLEVLDAIPDIERVEYVSDDDVLGITSDLQGIREYLNWFDKEIEKIQEMIKK